MGVWRLGCGNHFQAEFPPCPELSRLELIVPIAAVAPDRSGGKAIGGQADVRLATAVEDNIRRGLGDLQ